MKRADLLKEIRAYAKSIGEQAVETEDANHTKIELGGRRTVVARHGEINELAVKQIRKQLGLPNLTKGKKGAK